MRVPKNIPTQILKSCGVTLLVGDFVSPGAACIQKCMHNLMSQAMEHHSQQIPTNRVAIERPLPRFISLHHLRVDVAPVHKHGILWVRRLLQVTEFVSLVIGWLVVLLR
jgi:hypothetical protein